MAQRTPTRANLSEHILPNSSMMIGVCMTVISIIKVIGVSGQRHAIAEILAVDTLVFMISATFSYIAMRYEPSSRAATSVTLEKIADVAFMVGLAITTLVGFLLAYEII